MNCKLLNSFILYYVCECLPACISVPYVCLMPVEARRCWVPWWLGTAMWELSPGLLQEQQVLNHVPIPIFSPPFFLLIDAFTVPRASDNKVVCIVDYASINTL